MTIELCIDLTNHRPDEIFIILPATLLPRDDKKWPAEHPFVDLLKNLAVMGWGPLDFGEGIDTHLSLWLKKMDPHDAWKMTKLFIDKGGWV